MPEVTIHIRVSSSGGMDAGGGGDIDLGLDLDRVVEGELGRGGDAGDRTRRADAVPRGGGADLDSEWTVKVRTGGARPCMVCTLNAQSDNPRLPQLHANCKCTAVRVRKDTISDVLH